MPQPITLRPYVVMLPDAASGSSFDPAAEQAQFWKTPFGRLLAFAAKGIWGAVPSSLKAFEMEAKKLTIGSLPIVVTAYNDPNPPESVRELLCDHRESEPRLEEIKACPFPCWAVSAVGNEGATVIARAKAPGAQRVLEMSFNGASVDYAEAHSVITALMSTLQMKDEPTSQP